MNYSYCILFLFILFFGCDDDANLSTEQTERVNEILAQEKAYAVQVQQLEDYLKSDNSTFIEFSGNVLSNLDKLDRSSLFGSDSIRGDFEKLVSGKFIDAAYRYDLFKAIGHVATLDEHTSGREIAMYNVGIFNFLKKDSLPNIVLPKDDDGLIQELKIESKNSMALSFFVGGEIQNNQIVHGTIKEVAAVTVNEDNLNLDKLRNQYDSNNSSGKYLINQILIEEYLYKIYEKREKKIKVKEFPLIGSGVSFGADFFTEVSSYKKKNFVRVVLTPITDII